MADLTRARLLYALDVPEEFVSTDLALAVGISENAPRADYGSAYRPPRDTTRTVSDGLLPPSRRLGPCASTACATRSRCRADRSMTTSEKAKRDITGTRHEEEPALRRG